MISLVIGQRIHGVVEKIVFNGHGLVRHEGMVIFVPEVIPHEKVLIEISEVKSSFAHAKLIQVLESTQSRVEPICPHFGVCGGCQLQHIAYESHTAIKKQILQEALFKVYPNRLKNQNLGTAKAEGFADQKWPRICNTEPFLIDESRELGLASKSDSSTCLGIYQNDITFFSSELPFAWRRKITLHAENSPAGWSIGYYGKNQQLMGGDTRFAPLSIVPIDVCPIFSLDPHPIHIVKELISWLPNGPNRTCDISLFHLNDRLGLILEGNFALSKSLQECLVEHIPKKLNIDSFSFKFTNTQESHGPADWTFSCFGKIWHFSPNAFIQNHLSMCERIWSTVIRIASSLSQKGPILDLYSGIGVTAIELACKGFEVQAVEYSKESVSCSQKTWKSISHATNGTFFARSTSVEQFLLHWKKATDCILVNPPRTGLSKQALQSILKISCHNLIYVSCSPATLARDLHVFARHGFEIASVVGYDLFPQTTHFETIVTLRR
jgi:23S rRNA (uracil1939-C5)-methyltransferase